MKKTSQSLLWFAPPIIVMSAFVASFPWLVDLDKTLSLSITSAASIFVVVWGLFVASRMEGALDEVQLAGQRFAQAKGAAGGTFVTVLLLLPTPLVDWVTDHLILMTTNPELGERPDRHTLYIAIMFGFMLLIVMQALGTVVANAIWNRRVGWNA